MLIHHSIWYYAMPIDGDTVKLSKPFLVKPGRLYNMCALVVHAQPTRGV